MSAYLNRIETAVPPYEVHDFFLRFARARLKPDPRREALFARMAERGGIETRYGCFAPAGDPEGPVVDADALFRLGAFPDTATRMRLYERLAPGLAAAAVERLALGPDRRRISHLIVTSCTGFSAPGIDLDLVERCRLPSGVERTIVGFMGCYAAINALKLARHIVRSEPAARVLVVNVELCTLHLQDTVDLEEMLCFYLWGDGCAASLVSAEPTGLSLDRFHALLAGDGHELMGWHIRDSGFDMVLSGRVPGVIHDVLSRHRDAILDGAAVGAIDLWAVHPGGRSVLDAVERALDLPPAALGAAREVLRRYGNMSSATVMFVLKALMARSRRGARGCAMAFGPGLVTETMTFGRAA